MSNADESSTEAAGENKPLGAPRGKRPRIRISCVDQLGTCRCHHGHKPGDVFDFDRDRGKMCAMACHVGFPYIDILRYGGTVPGNEPGTAKFRGRYVERLARRDRRRVVERGFSPV